MVEVVRATEAWAGRDKKIDTSPTDGLAPLLEVLEKCRFALITSPLPFDGLPDIEAELRWVLADALVTWATGSPKPPVRTLQPSERWRVAHVTGMPHGGLYELEQEHSWIVVNWETKEGVLRYDGESDQSYTGEGDGWTDPTWEGVQDVSISPDGTHAVVVDADGTKRQVPLPPTSSEPS